MVTRLTMTVLKTASRRLSHLTASFNLPTNPLDLSKSYAPSTRSISTSPPKMANIHTQIPELKLNDGISIPMVSMHYPISSKVNILQLGYGSMSPHDPPPPVSNALLQPEQPGTDPPRAPSTARQSKVSKLPSN